MQTPVDWREFFIKQSVGKCKEITSRISVYLLLYIFVLMYYYLYSRKFLH